MANQERNIGDIPSVYLERPKAESLSRGRPYTEVQLFFLLRLERLLRLRREHAQLAASSDGWSRLMSKAIYSTYCDTLEQNVGEDAKKLLARDEEAQKTQD